MQVLQNWINIERSEPQNWLNTKLSLSHYPVKIGSADFAELGDCGTLAASEPLLLLAAGFDLKPPFPLGSHAH